MKKLVTEELRISFGGVIPFLLIVVFIPLISYLIWLFYPAKQLEIVVIDKTVPTDTYQEHHALFWTLKHLKIQNKNNDFYDEETDYFGFFPDNTPSFGTSNDLLQLDENEIIETATNLDVLYFADTYGVFEEDFKEHNSDEVSKKIYGGLNRGDINLLREAVAQKKTIIAEFNTMASPTPVGIRTEFENLMGLKWTGWIARYFEEMDSTINTDLPKWFISQYLEQHENNWVPAGPGIVFVHEKGRVEAFSDGLDYFGEIPKIRTQRINQQGFKLPELVPYPEWFDIVLIERDYQVISFYDIDPSTKGKEKLRDMGLPRFFPAAVFKNVGEGQFYYFAGDFSDLRSSIGSVHFTGLPMLWRGFHLVSDYKDRKSFYWNYFYPLLSQILEKAAREKQKD
ncbi:hypothetical protein LV84_01968 [Algoriphagus ratkowskyi]|uniref:Uncharacterized protein n=1 Tax=Algoriphagus ratkowskyi TaxID=57028 RepID=A0A2W7T100_9BACT|nr:hypothetical protein [Algoriphagus ratkowskyi]PZX56842.1 hypothetical protein LV84_01968 [Algoriphagus ratkowskyi]TXD79757.1 hypothetical protein ESW18_01095 [Algoriphagus ratkowskyi]